MKRAEECTKIRNSRPKNSPDPYHNHAQWVYRGNTLPYPLPIPYSRTVGASSASVLSPQEVLIHP